MEKIKCFGFDMDYTLAGKLNTYLLITSSRNREFGKYKKKLDIF